MRSALLAVSLLTGALSLAACSGDTTGPAPAAAESSLTAGGPAPSSAAATTTIAAGTPVTIQAGTGTEMFGVPGVTVRIATCDTDTEKAVLKTDREGTATYPATAAGCYRATVLSVPSGCHPNEVDTTTVVVKLGEPAATRFLIHCA